MSVEPDWTDSHALSVYHTHRYRVSQQSKVILSRYLFLIHTKQRSFSKFHFFLIRGPQKRYLLWKLETSTFLQCNLVRESEHILVRTNIAFSFSKNLNLLEKYNLLLKGSSLQSYRRLLKKEKLFFRKKSLKFQTFIGGNIISGTHNLHQIWSFGITFNAHKYFYLVQEENLKITISIGNETNAFSIFITWREYIFT